MKTENPQTNLKRLEDLSRKEVDMIYSLSRVGEWSSLEIARKYKISADDVRKVVDNYIELREACKAKPPDKGLQQNPESTVRKPRKRRSDAIYATAAERQAAHRARLKESCRAATEKPSPAGDTDNPPSADKELSVTLS